MNGEANLASEKWEELISEIIFHKKRGKFLCINLGDSKADLYDFANEILMRRMREELGEALRTARGFRFFPLTFENNFFMTMNEQQQRSFFRIIFNLSVYCSFKIGKEGTGESADCPAITISTPALLETLPQLHRGVSGLQISNFALTRQSDVQALSNIILSKRRILHYVRLESIECPVDDCNKQDSDESNGFLDPLFYAASISSNISISTKPRSVHSSLVSPRALRALIAEGEPRYGQLRLNDLGLTDSHVLAIVDGLSTTGLHFEYLNLDSNPGITAQGYGALLNLINRANKIGNNCFTPRGKFQVDDKIWEGELNLVSEMNSKYRRWEYLTNGTFTSEQRMWQWLERVVGIPRNKRGPEKKKMDAKHLTLIWYTLRQNPDMMRVSQAPTRTMSTKKRKPTPSTSSLPVRRSARISR